MAEHEAASLSPADVQTAANLCSDGDILVLPAGTYNGFNTQVNVSLGVSIRGAGKTTTVINKTSTSESKLIHYPTGPVPTATMEISGFTVRGAHDGSTIDDGLMIDWCTSGSGVYHVNIHDMVFSGCGDAGLYIQGLAEGVIYNCDFLDNYAVGAGLCYGIALTGIYAGETGGYYGTHSWTTWPANTNPGWGGEHFIFVEDCTFDGNRHSVDGGWGAKYVCRNNTFGGTPVGIYSAHINSHGRVPFDSGNRGTRAVEVYNNAIVIDHYEDGITSQSGDALIWSNVLTGAISGGHGIMIENAGCTHDAEDYPASDQARNTYIWGNTENGTDSDSDVYPAADPGVGNFCTEWLVKNRDFYLSAYSYTPYTYPHPLRGYAPPADPEINIQYNSINIPDGNTYNFGSKTLNSNTDQIFTLGNIGAGDLTLSGTPIIVITGDNADQFSVQAQPTTPIAGFSNTTFTLRFTPTSLGAKVAAIAIVNNDADENPYNITLNGIGSSGQYYVDQADGNDSWDGLAPVYVSGTNGPWKTIAQVNGSSFLAGDTVLFQCGETWREALEVPGSGSDGSPITFGAYGTGADPLFMNSEAKNSTGDWTDDTGNIWYTHITPHLDVGHIAVTSASSPTILGDKKDTKVGCVDAGDFFYDQATDNLYVYCTQNPATEYSGYIECAYGESATLGAVINIEQDYITIDGIEIKHSGSQGITVYKVTTGTTGVTIQNCKVSYIGGVYLFGTTRWGNGIESYKSNASLIIQNNDVSQCFDAGITVECGTNSDSTVMADFLIDQNTVDYCGMGIYYGQEATGTPSTSNFAISGNTVSNSGLGWGGVGSMDGAAMELWRTTGTISNFVISGNTIDTTITGTSGQGFGIALYGMSASILRNTITGTGNSPIFFNTATSDASGTVAYNLIYGSNADRSFVNIYDNGSGPVNIYNNVVWKLSAGSGYPIVATIASTGITVKNNIVGCSAAGDTQALLYTGTGCTLASDYNLFYKPDDQTMWRVASDEYTKSQWATYKSEQSQDANSPTPADPVFVTPGTDFRLQVTSPAINAGVDVGLTEDYAGNPIVGLPDIGAYEYREAITAVTIFFGCDF